METNEQIPTQTPSVPVAPIESRPKPSFPLWGAALIAIFIGGGMLLTWSSFQQNEGFPTLPTPTPTTIPTPTPIRALSALASGSAFLSLEANVASLSTLLRNFVTDDPSLSPPVLDLPLGF